LRAIFDFERDGFSFIKPNTDSFLASISFAFVAGLFSGLFSGLFLGFF
jgi:hypothetical protein